MPIPRRLVVLAVSAAATGAVFYLRNRLVAAEAERARRGQGATPSAAPTGGDTGAAEDLAGAPKELALFLAGDTWHDEGSWKGIWSREGIPEPDAWLRTRGRDVLRGERRRLEAHPALLAGCRRRWIVVCRYAGMDVADAAALWNATEEAPAA